MTGVTFGTKHSFNDWGLYMTSIPEISPPEVKTNYIEIPGRDGELDLTEVVTKKAMYKNRTLSFEFTIVDKRSTWSDTYSKITNYLHGKTMSVVLDEDAGYYYVGRLQVNEWKSDQCTSIIIIEGNCNPYKYSLETTDGKWKWDTFNFNNGIIRNYSNIQITESGTIDVIGYDIDTQLITINCSSAMKLVYNNETYNLVKGKNTMSDLVVSPGDNNLVFTGTGTVSILVTERSF